MYTPPSGDIRSTDHVFHVI